MRKGQGLQMPGNEEKLVKMLKYVSEHNDFYKKRIKEYGISNPLDITQWPIMHSNESFTKEIISNSYDKIKVAYSSGSTGLSKKIVWYKNDHNKMCVNTWRLRKKWYDIRPDMKSVFFYFSSLFDSLIDFKHVNSSHYISGNNLFINLSLIYNNPSSALKILKHFSPELIFAFPSVLMTLIGNNCVDDVDVFSNVRYVELYGENLLPNQLSDIMRCFNNANCAIMFGTTETGVIALTCPKMKMHVITDNCYVESKENHLYVTSLVNSCSPFIRCDFGDQGSIVVNHSRCQCGVCSDVLTGVIGREPGFVQLRDGNAISSVFITECINLINAEYDCSITSFYAEQLIAGNLDVYISIALRYEKWKKVIGTKLKEYLFKVVPQLSVVKVITDQFGSQVKRNYFINKCEK